MKHIDRKFIIAWCILWCSFTVRMSAQLVETPALASPADGSTNQPATVTLQWNSAVGATSYQVQVATATSFINPVFDQSGITTTSQTVGPLPNATIYYWRVRASSLTVLGTWSTVWSFTTAPPIPSTPSLVSPAQNSIDQPVNVTFAWDSSQYAASYHFQIAEDTVFVTSLQEKIISSGTSVTIQNLVLAKKYFWRVNASNFSGTSAWSAIRNFQTVPPPPPTPLLSLPANDAINQPTAVRCVWQSASTAVKYWIQVSKFKNFSTFILNDSLVADTFMDISSLEKNFSYFWKVAAINSGGISNWSPIWEFTTIPNPPVTPVLAGPSNGVTIDSTSVQFSWNAAANTSLYYFQLAVDSTFTTLISNDSTVLSSFTISGLQYNKKYFWRVRAANAGGISAWTSVFSFITRDPNSYTGPNLLFPMNGSRNMPQSITISWSPQSGASSYHLQISKNKNFDVLVYDNAAITTTATNVNLAEKDSKYYWHVQTSFSVFTSNWSDIWEFTTAANLPATPSLQSPSNGAVNQPTSITLLWNSSAGAETYHLQFSPREDFSTKIVDNSWITDTTYQVNGLKEDSTYYWRIAAINGSGRSNWSSASSFKTIPAPPIVPVIVTPPKGTLLDSTTVVLAWNSFPDAQFYRLQISSDSTFVSAVLYDSVVQDTTFQISHLQGNTLYFWRVNAKKADSSQVWSAPSNFATQSAQPYAGPTLVSPPNNAVNQSPTLTLAWNPDPSAISYHVQVSTDFNFANIIYDNSSISKTSQQVGPLQEATDYYWRVRSNYILFVSEWSLVWKFTTVQKAIPAPALLAPANGSTDQPLSVLLQWTGNPKAICYNIQIAKDSLFMSLVESDSMLATSLWLDSLSVRTIYYWHVRTQDTTGWSNFSSVWKFITVDGKLPTAITVQATGVTANSMTMNALVNPNNLTTTVRFRYGLTEAYGNSVDGIPLTVSGDSSKKITNLLSGLKPNTTYHYCVSATNALGSTEGADETVTTSLPQYPASWNVRTTIPFPTYPKPTDYQPNDYKIVGLPGASYMKMDSLLPGVPHKDWELFWDDGNGTEKLVKYNGGEEFSCWMGRAFWLIKKGNWNINGMVPSAPLDSANELHIPLHAGWNLVTNPFAGAMTWQGLQQANGVTEPIYSFFNGFSISDTLQPYIGYYFFNAANMTSLRVSYANLYPPAENLQNVPSALPKSETDRDWRIQITLETEEAKDNTAWLGISTKENVNLNTLNFHKPKGIGTLPVVYFNRPEWDSRFSTFATDIRSQFTDKQIWNFTAHVPISTKSSLKFSGIDNLPSNFEAYLVDQNFLRVVNLRTTPSYRFTSGMSESQFQFITGTKDSVEQIIRSLQMPKSFSLGSNYPNPFNPQTTIPVEIPFRSTITLKVFNILGQEIKTLFHGEIDAGKFWFTWDGKNDADQNVASGVYLYRLTAESGELVQIRKMILTR